MSTENRQALVNDAIAVLTKSLGKRISQNYSIREQHSHDESWFESALPDAVCFPESADDISHLLQVCSERRVPVIPFGTGTGVVGQVNAIHGGVCVDLSSMNQIIDVNPSDFDCTVQAGVTRNQLNDFLRDTGLFFPVDPGADASLGGMAATRASGTTSVRYGTMRENVLALKVILANGQVITTGGRARKSAAGYDLTHLFIGSEGTLGIITELTLRLHGRTESSATAVVQFDQLSNAVNTAMAAMQFSLPVAAIELIDETLIDAINKYSSLQLVSKPSLLVSFHGTKCSMDECADLFLEIAKENLSVDTHWINSENEQSSIWKARHNAARAFLSMRPNAKNISTDVCVPISKLAQCIEETTSDLNDNINLITTIAGHVGDGNFHVAFLVDPSRPEEKCQVQKFYDRLILRALNFGGTCTGEHGIGIQKLQHLRREFGESAVDAMWSIKRALDPGNIMNPGKKLPSME